MPPRPPAIRDVKANFRLAADYIVDGEERQSEYHPRIATDICGLNKGPEGKIYGSTAISMHIFCFDPASRSLENLGRVGWGSGEVYDVIGHSEKVSWVAHGGGYWAVYDPSRLWDPQPNNEGFSQTAIPRSSASSART